MTNAEAIRVTKNLLEHLGLKYWKVKIVCKLGKPEQVGFCSYGNCTIYLVESCLAEEAKALWLIRHECAHAATSHEISDHGPRFLALVSSLRRWNGVDGGVYES